MDKRREVYYSTLKSAVIYTENTKRDDFWREKFTHGLPEAAYRNMAPKVTTGGDLGYARLTWHGNREGGILTKYLIKDILGLKEFFTQSLQ